jgi:hypothetical protein
MLLRSVRVSNGISGPRHTIPCVARWDDIDAHQRANSAVRACGFEDMKGEMEKRQCIMWRAAAW